MLYDTESKYFLIISHSLKNPKKIKTQIVYIFDDGNAYDFFLVNSQVFSYSPIILIYDLYRVEGAIIYETSGVLYGDQYFTFFSI